MLSQSYIDEILRGRIILIPTEWNVFRQDVEPGTSGITNQCSVILEITDNSGQQKTLK